MAFLNHFRRVTSGGNFLPEIDGLRFVAIGSVILYHGLGYFEKFGKVAYSPTIATQMIWNGFYGVELFFVISGFILGFPFVLQYLAAGKPVSLKKYFLRRLTRLEPPYILSLLTLFVLFALTKGQSLTAMLPHLFAQMGYMHNAIFGMSNAVNGVAWSLEIEVQFYCLVPLICLALRIQNKAVRRTAFVSTIILAGILQKLLIHPGRMQLNLLFYVQYFLAGILLSDIFVTDWHEAPHKSAKWDLVALAAWPTIFLVPITQAQIILPMLIFTAYYATFRGKWGSRIFSSDWLTIVGGMCYTIYLFHYPIISAVGRLSRSMFTGTNFLVYLGLQMVICSIGILVFSFAYFALIERPCMYRDWPQRLWAKLTSKEEKRLLSRTAAQ